LSEVMNAYSGATVGNPIKDTKGQWNKIHQSLIDGTLSWIPYWRELQAYINPQLGYFYERTPNYPYEYDVFMIDQAAQQSNIIQAAGMQTGISSPSRPWFKLKLRVKHLNESDDNKTWLSRQEDKMYQMLAGSNFYNASHQFYMELGCFGHAAMFVEPSLDEIARFITLTCGEYAMGLGSDGKPNMMARRIKMTSSQIVDKFGYERTPLQIRMEFDADKHTIWHEVKHLIKPNPDHNPSSPKSKEMKYHGVYWMNESPETEPLQTEGYKSFPVMFARWNVQGQNVYGFGPGWQARNDSKSIQLIMTDILSACEIGVKPPMLAPVSMQRGGGVNLTPGRVIWYDPQSGGNPGIMPAMELKFDIPSAMQAKGVIEDQIRKAFFADLFLMLQQLDNHNMTAREIIERSQEKMTMIGPVLERLNHEFLKPVIHKIWELMLDIPGLIDPPPQGIQGIDMDIEYISILAQAQRMSNITAIEQWMQFSLEMVKGGLPQAAYKINVFGTLDEYGDMLGVPPAMITSDKDATAQMQQAQQQAQQQQKMAAMQQMAQSAQHAAGATQQLGNTPLANGNSALDALLGNQPQGGPGQ